jgi:hypothetical protein
MSTITGIGVYVYYYIEVLRPGVPGVHVLGAREFMEVGQANARCFFGEDAAIAEAASMSDKFPEWRFRVIEVRTQTVVENVIRSTWQRAKRLPEPSGEVQDGRHVSALRGSVRDGKGEPSDSSA